MTQKTKPNDGEPPQEDPLDEIKKRLMNVEVVANQLRAQVSGFTQALLKLVVLLDEKGVIHKENFYTLADITPAEVR